MQFNSLPLPEFFSVPRELPSMLTLDSANPQQSMLNNAENRIERYLLI